jgi:hypothetical protein
MIRTIALTVGALIINAGVTRAQDGLIFYRCVGKEFHEVLNDKRVNHPPETPMDKKYKVQAGKIERQYWDNAKKKWSEPSLVNEKAMLTIDNSTIAWELRIGAGRFSESINRITGAFTGLASVTPEKGTWDHLELGGSSFIRTRGKCVQDQPWPEEKKLRP